LNKKKFEQFYKNNFDKIYRFYTLRSLSREIAEDLTSSTFLAYAEIIEAKKEIKDERNYLYGIAKIKLIDYFKIKYQEVPLEIENLNIAEEIDHSTQITTDRIKLISHLNKLIEALPSKQKVIMQLRVFEKLKLIEIAQKLGKDLNYVKTTQKRALKKLQDLSMKVYTL
jgi:RNA polymerase sigma-70 factor (ECF subfamily)